MRMLLGDGPRYVLLIAFTAVLGTADVKLFYAKLMLTLSSRWQKALRIMAQPANVGSSLAELGRLADEFLFLAGDTTVDTRWYTKRASLSAIYSAAEVYQATRDRSSVDFLDTERFLDARLDGARRVGYAADSVQEWVGFTAMAAVNVLRSKGVRI